MALKPNEDMTRQAAHLARLDLSKEEIHTFTEQLDKILEYVDQLQKVEVNGVEPLVTPVPLETALREDAARPAPVDPEGAPKVLESAPESLHGGFKVPQIL